MAGRKPFIPTQQQRDLVSQLAAMGVPQDDIRKLILKPDDRKPVSLGLLERVFREELDTGELKANAKVAGALYTAAINGNTTAQIFWLKTRARWRETTDVNVNLSRETEEDDARAAVLTQRLVAKLTAKSD